jgi:hypothetical protein
VPELLLLLLLLAAAAAATTAAASASASKTGASGLVCNLKQSSMWDVGDCMSLSLLFCVQQLVTRPLSVSRCCTRM